MCFCMRIYVLGEVFCARVQEVQINCLYLYFKK